VRHSIWLWAGFNAFVLAMLALDLGILRRRAHEVSIREAGVWSAVWVVLALTFAFGVHQFAGPRQGLEFLTGYLIEKALSVDNIFVFVLILSYFGVPPKYHHRVLFWGVVGALLTRGTMIGLGAVLVSRFHWILYLFGALLLVTAFRILTTREEEAAVQENLVLRLAQRFVPVTPVYHGQRFFVRVDGPTGLHWYATPLFIVLIAVETTDVIFAVDSIPAIFAVTRDPFIIYTSNVFAILGLRSLYFLLAGVLHRFQYLKTGIALVLVFVGLKMLTADIYEIPIGISLGVVATVLGVSVVASLVAASRRERKKYRREPPRPKRRPHTGRLSIMVPLLALPVASAPGAVGSGVELLARFGVSGVPV
jgi:tellurite resistance protein TerC